MKILKAVMFCGIAAIPWIPSHVCAADIYDLLEERGVIARSDDSGRDETESGLFFYIPSKGFTVDYPAESVSFSIGALLQERYEFTDNDRASGKGNTSSFSTERARIILSGSMVYDEFKYYIENEFAGNSADDRESGAQLKDAYIDWAACYCSGLRIGQFKPELSLQFSAGDARLQFADRSVVSDYFSVDRQQGMRGYYTFLEDRLRFSGAMFNGESSGEGINRPGTDARHLGVAAVRYNFGGRTDPYSEGDTDWNETVAASAGAAYAYSEERAGSAGTGQESSTGRFSSDLSLKYRGFSLQTEMQYRTESFDDAGNNADPIGFYAQSGYFIQPKTVEAAVRYGFIDCDRGKGGGVCEGRDTINEVTAGLNYYLRKHDLKLQLNYTHLEENAGSGGRDISSNRWIAQLSAML